MIHFDIGQPDRGLQILCIGAHCDDIEIGCGGTLLKLISQGKVGHVTWVVFASNPLRAEEAQKSAEKYLQDVPNKDIQIKSYRDAFLNFEALSIKEEFEHIKKGFSPDIVFTHYRHDRHQDHRLLSDLAWNTFRDHLVLEYEIPKYDGDLGQPNVFVHLEENIAHMKVEYLLEYFVSQVGKHWFDKESFHSLMRIRGMESACKSKYAEAFYGRKIVL